MFKAHKSIALFACLTLAMGSVSAFADPGNGKGKNNGNGHGGEHAQGGKNKGGGVNEGHGGGPSVDRNSIYGLLGGHRDYWSPGPALPPGIQKNLARGKPLPPGIAKKLDGRLLGQLPRYEGYEWQQVGTDLILVAIATGIIYEVLNGAFD